MFNKRIITLISFILLFVFVLQFSPVLLPDQAGAVKHAPNTKAAIVHSSHFSGMQINVDTRKPTIKFSATKFQDFSGFHYSWNIYSFQKLSLYGVASDSRQKIQNHIIHYFNGSKYKSLCLHA